MTKLTDNIPMEHKISRQFKLWERTYKKVTIGDKKQIIPSISVSSELGSQGDELAANVAESLGWELFDKQLVDYIAEHAHVQKYMVEMFDERTQNEIHNWVLTLLDNRALGSDKYYKHLVTILRIIGERGQAVVLGRGGHLILPHSRTLKIRTISPIDKRITQVAQKNSLSRKEATGLIIQSDKEKRSFIKRFYHSDWDSPYYFDMILNLDSISLDLGREMICVALKKKFPDMPT